jgi:phosphoserine/homoserine phosphotransferase
VTAGAGSAASRVPAGAHRLARCARNTPRAQRDAAVMQAAGSGPGALAASMIEFGAVPADSTAIGPPAAGVTVCRSASERHPTLRKGSPVQIVCLDLEGVLIPEIWIEFAERAGIAALRRTTRDEPDYDVLMKYRLDILAQHRLGLPAIQEVIAGMGPMAGAREFLDALRADYQVVILSDTFYEFAHPLMRQLGWPTLFCHSLEADAEGRLVNYHLRMPDQKREAVRRFKELNFKVVAAGDSYNDIAMLGEADGGILFDPPASVVREFPHYPVARSYDALRGAIDQAFARAR